jgi:hypothetical protein
LSDSFLDKYVKRANTATRESSVTDDGEVIDFQEQSSEGATQLNGSSSLSLLGDSSDAATDFGSFGWLRGVRERALMLELRKKDGHIMAIAYAWIERMEFDPSHGITLYAPGQRIRITGSGLNIDVRPNTRVFDGLIRHRVPWLQECDSNESLRTSGNTVSIERITWED